MILMFLTKISEERSKMRRPIYTHALHCERIGEREDGTTFERFRVMIPEDVLEAIDGLWEADLISRDIRNAFVTKLGLDGDKK